MQVGDIVTNGKLYRKVLAIQGELIYPDIPEGDVNRYNILSGAFLTKQEAEKGETEYRNEFHYYNDEPIFKAYEVCK